jgi:hypothetical protein
MIRHALDHSIFVEANLGPRRSGGINIGSYCCQVSNVTGGHALERCLASKRFVSPGNPCVSKRWVGVDNLKRLPNARNIPNAPKRIVRDTANLSPLPLEEGALRRIAEDAARSCIIRPPVLYDLEISFQSKALPVGRQNIRNSMRSRSHLPSNATTQ